MLGSGLQNLIDEIKSKMRIEDVIGSRISLNSQLKALCPFHDDTNPSLSVHNEKQYFHCFGCNVGGDVIRFLELYEHKSFKQVLAELATNAGIRYQDFDTKQLKQVTETRQTENVLAATTQFYVKSLSTEVKRYLQNDRGFTDDTITKFRIGYANGGLKSHLIEERTFTMDLCLKSGVLKRWDDGRITDFFYKRIIFPNMKHGRVVHISGRILDGQGPKYLHLPGPLKHLFNEDALNNDCVVLCEGAPDCISAVQAGFHAVAILGTSQFNESHQSLFRRCLSVYICFDGDEAGRKGTERIARLIPDKAIAITSPDGMDLNDFLSEHTPDDLQKLLDGGQPYLDMEIDRIRQIPANRQMDELRGFLPQLGKLDKFGREKYSNVVKREFKLNKKTIDVAIDQGREDTHSSASTETAKEEPTFTDEENQAAVKLLKDPDLIGKLSQITDDMGCVGEIDNKIVVYLALTSRILAKPISLIIKGDSSGGKSFLVETITSLFPSSEVLMFTTVTPKALYHRTDGLSHKALIIFERHGAEESDYSIRSLQSEGKLLISMSVKDPESGQWTTCDKEVPGPVAYIETTTQTHLHQENETRCFEVFVDDSEDQTRHVHEAQKRRYLLPSSQKSCNTTIWIVAQTMLKPYPVIIPYINLIEFPEKPLRVRRDHDRFLTLIEVNTVLHQYQREKITRDGTDYLVARFDDYAVAYTLASGILQQTIKQITPKAEALAALIQGLQDDNGDQPLTRRAICEASSDSPNTIKKYLHELIKQGVIHEDRSAKAHTYSILRLPTADDNLLIDPKELESRFLEVQLNQRVKLGQTQPGQINPQDNNKLNPPDQSDQGFEGPECAP